MSTQVMPNFSAIGFPVNRTPIWSTQTQQSISGKEVRQAFFTYPRYQWDLVINLLRSDSTNHELQTLLGFFNARQGSYDTFLYSDADDNAVTGQIIADGDGTTKAFQLIKSFGGYIEPVLAPNAVSAVYLGGVSIPSAGISPPSVPTLGSSSGGSLGGTTYYVKITYVTQSGETQVSSEASLAVSSGHLLTVKESTSAPTGAIGFNVYVGTSSGTETLQNGVGTPVTLGSTWTEPTSGLVAGHAMPAGNTTGWSVNNWGSASPGVLTFAGAPLNTVVITADFSYYYPVRMVEDKLSLSLFLNQYYECKKFSFISVK